MICCLRTDEGQQIVEGENEESKRDRGLVYLSVARAQEADRPDDERSIYRRNSPDANGSSCPAKRGFVRRAFGIGSWQGIESRSQSGKPRHGHTRTKGPGRENVEHD